MQASTLWTPPSGTLGAILGDTRDRVRALRAREAELTAAAEATPPPRSFVAALRASSVSVVAEVKRRSPSKGAINLSLDAAAQAAAYEAGGAAAISVLTEPVHFGGSADDVAAVGARVRVPVLKKDFHVHPIQLLEARALGASAVLLIARALEPTYLLEMMGEAGEAGLEAMVEVRTDAELERAVAAGARAIGVNSRDLETLLVDRSVCERLVPRIPPGIVAVWESGVSVVADVVLAASRGADAVLVGSALSTARDPVAAVRALAGVLRADRGRG